MDRSTILFSAMSLMWWFGYFGCSIVMIELWCSICSMFLMVAMSRWRLLCNIDSFDCFSSVIVWKVFGWLFGPVSWSVLFWNGSWFGRYVGMVQWWYVSQSKWISRGSGFIRSRVFIFCFLF